VLAIEAGANPSWKQKATKETTAGVLAGNHALI
jgi:hypothetical protein